MKALMSQKNNGRLILIFPSGTRYRPWDPSTKRGVREIDSYIRSFDYMCFVAINGQILHVHQGDMMDDEVRKDVVRISAGPVLSCSEFRDKARAEADAGLAGVTADKEPIDKKQVVADTIMAELEKMHITGEEKRKKLLS
jgi:glycerol-3-phosphate O-acyltransferase